MGLGYMEKVRENEYRILAACLLRASEIDDSKNLDTANSKISKKVFERLDRANKSRAVQQFYREKKIPRDWNATSTFFEISTPGDRTGIGGSKKHGNTERNTNNGNVNDLRLILNNALKSCDSDSLLSKTAAGGGGAISRRQIVTIAEVFNELISTWGKALERIGVVEPSSLQIEIENLESGE